MSQYDPHKLILNITDALANSVPKRDYNDVLTALKRCQEMIGKLSSVLVDLDADQKHGELMLEAKLYANVLGGFFDDMNLDFFDLRKGYDPREYLKNKGVIKHPTPSITVESRDSYIARLRLEHEASMDRLAKARAKEAQDIIVAQLAIKKRGRGRPIGSKNKPKPAPVKTKKGAHK
jgi:hypothetical protein